MPDSAAPASTPSPTIDLKSVVYALNHITRWHMLRELVTGEPRMISEIAETLRLPATNISKHMAALQIAGVVVRSRHSYQIADRFRPVAGRREIDLGHCVVRFDR